MLNRVYHPPRSIASKRATAERNALRRRELTNRLYDTAAWRTLRSLHLREHPFCVDCGRHGNIVDHLIPHQGRSDLFFDPANLRTMCKRDHDRKTGRENPISNNNAIERQNEIGPIKTPTRLPQFAKSRIPLTIVCGPPGAGKTTYVQQRAAATDVVIDLDEIIAEVSGLPLYQADHRKWLAHALTLRNNRLRELAKDVTHTAAWFIISAPVPEERAQWGRMLGGKVVLLDTPREVCMQRIRADARRATQQRRMIGAVTAWFRTTPTHGEAKGF